MRRILRVLILLFLMTAIPVRGAIGASMILCVPGYGVSNAALQFAGGPMHDADHPSQTGAHHHAAPSDGDGHDNEAVTSALDHGGSAKTVHGMVTCSLCADCCAGGTILVPPALTVPVVEHADDPFPPVLVRFERRPPDGLERPPHTLLV